MFHLGTGLGDIRLLPEFAQSVPSDKLDLDFVGSIVYFSHSWIAY